MHAPYRQPGERRVEPRPRTAVIAPVDEPLPGMWLSEAKAGQVVDEDLFKPDWRERAVVRYVLMAVLVAGGIVEIVLFR